MQVDVTKFSFEGESLRGIDLILNDEEYKSFVGLFISASQVVVPLQDEVLLARGILPCIKETREVKE